MRNGKDQAIEWRRKRITLTNGDIAGDVLLRLVRCGKCLQWQGKRRAHGVCRATGIRVSTHYRCEAFLCSREAMFDLLLDTMAADGKIERIITRDGVKYGSRKVATETTD